MSSSHLDYARFDLGRHLMRAPVGLGALVRQSSEAVGGVAHEPAMKGSSIDPITDRGSKTHSRSR
jgi:hypothetical protein